MMRALLLLVGLQWAGELLARLTGWPVPGPVLGLCGLYAVLVRSGGAWPELTATAQGLLRHLSLLFVPAGVGIVAHAGLVGREWLPLLVAVVVSTLVGLLVTALVAWALLRRQRDKVDAGC